MESIEQRARQVSILTTTLLPLKGTLIIWCYWILKDAETQKEYRRSLREATHNILEQVTNGTLMPAAGAEAAYAVRNEIMIRTRERTSPLGLLIAQSLKPSERGYDFYLNKNARSRFRKDFRDLTDVQAKEVSAKRIVSQRYLK